MVIDVELARSLTPACSKVHHLNNAGASPSPRPVLDVVIGHLEREAEIGGYEAALEAAERHEAVYSSIARMLGGAPDEIGLPDSATRAWDLVFQGLAGHLREGDRILTGRSEYVSNAIALLQACSRTGAIVELVEDDEHGQLDVARLEAMMDERVKLVVVTHVPTGGGLVNPAAEIGRVTRAWGVPFMLDACQSAGQLELDVERIGCDVLTAAGRKFLRGPRGTGFAWVRSGLVESIDPPMPDLHSATWTSPWTFEVRGDARRFEMWESSVAARLGLGAAVDHALGWGLDRIEARVVELAAGLRTRLESIRGVEVRDKGERRCAIVTFSVEGRCADEVCEALRVVGVNTSVTRVDSAQFDLPQRGLPDLVRASVHYFNDEHDLDALCEGVERIAAET